MGVLLEQVNRSGAAFVRFAGPMLIQSAVLILILLLVDVFLRKRVRAVFRYWIWVLVLLKLILPTSLSSPFSVGSFFGERLAHVEISGPGAVAARESGQAEGSEAAALPFLDTSGIRDYGYVPARSASSEVEPILTEAAVSRETGSVRLSWQAVVFSLWLAVVVAMGLLLAQRAVFVRGLMRQARDADGVMKDALERCRVAMGVRRRVGLKISVNATSPAVCGLVRPVILMPHNLGRGLGAGQLRPVFFHELAHIRRGDLWVNLAQTVLQVLYFYNPLLWIANSVIRRVREQAVDEAVLVAMGERAGQYPEALVRVARLAFERPALSLRLIGVVESKSALASRVKRILGRPIPKSAKLGIFGLLVIIVAAAILLPMSKTADGDESDWRKPAERWRARAVKKTSLESSFGGWRNLPFEVSAAEEAAVKRCRKLLVYWPREANDATSKKLLEDIRVELEGMVWEMPEFFYGEFLLAMWHREHGDAGESERLLKASYEHAPVILVQKYQYEDGEPIEGARIQDFEIECNRVKKGGLDPSLGLRFRDLATDDDGCIYVPVYDTVYRRYSASLPKGYNIAYPTLGWFSSRGKVGLMPVAKSNSTEGGLYEKARASRDLKIKVGPTTFGVERVVRWNGRGEPVFEDGRGESADEAGLKAPDYTRQAAWLDVAQVHISPGPGEYDVLELRVFDHKTRAFLRGEEGVGYG